MRPNSKLKTQNSKLNGVGLIEILVVVAIFAILGVLTTRSILITIRSSHRSESLVKVKENLDYSLAVMERQLRNATEVVCTSSIRIDYKDALGDQTNFRCAGGLEDRHIASGSARLTSTEVLVTTCSFSCPTAGGEKRQPSVTITLEAEDKNISGIEKGKITTSTRIYLRTY